MKNKLTFIMLGFMLLLMTTSAHALTQNFDSWATTDNSPHTITNAGWILSDGIIKDTSFDSAVSIPNTAWLLSGSGLNSYVQTPLLVYGIGKLQFYCKIYQYGSISSIPLQILTSKDGTNWTLTATVNCDSKTWQQQTVVLNDPDARYIKIYKELVTSGADIVGLDDITTDNPPAMVTISDVAPIPDPPEINDEVDISCKITPTALAAGISATLSYSIGTATYTTINMITNGQPNGYITASKIPGQSAGTKVNYYITATFVGNNAMSPTNYPAAGSAAPAFYRVSTRAFLSDYKSMDIIDSASGTMVLIDDYYWQTVIDNASAIPNANFRFQGTTDIPVTTTLWGDATQNATTLPIISTAVLNDPAFNLTTFPAGQIVFRFNETTLNYIARQANFQSFDSWPDSPNYNTTTYNNWLAVNAKIETPADADRRFRGKISILNSNSASWVQSPYITDGIGEISFWYRNWETNGVPETECFIQISTTGGTNDSEWITADTISAIGTIAYNNYSLLINDYDYHYVRIMANTNSGQNAALCIDEFMILYGGAAVSMTNLTTTPTSPVASESFDITVDITPLVGASNIQATAYYRSGIFGVYTPLLMTNTSGNTYTTISPVPPNSGDNGGAGIVQYYVECSFDGLESDLSSPILTPFGSPDNPASVTIEPATISITNVINSPDPVAVNTPITVTAEIIPQNGAISITPALWYRTGNSGIFSKITMDKNGSETNFITTTPIPGQSIPGEYIQYYLEVSFVGAGADSPTNYPASGYITIPIHTEDITSSFDSVDITGVINTNLYLIDNNTWFGIAAESSNIVDGAIKFVAQIGTITNNYGDSAQPFTDMPIFGSAENSATDIIMGGTNSGIYVFRYNEINNQYSVQLCDYVDFENFINSDSAFATYTNSNNWIISNARTTTPGETDKTLRGSAVVLNNTNAAAYAQSPYLTNGIGEISFWYRNWWESSDTDPVTVLVQKSIDGQTGWETIATIDNALNFDYIHFSGFFYEPEYHYVRIVNGNETPHALLLLDEIVISKAGPGAAFSNLQHTPTNPEVPETVDVSVDIDAVHYATDMAATLWYRFGTNGIFDSIAMNNISSNTYTTVSSIPRGYDGIVEYYIEADFKGIVNSPKTFTANPAAGKYGATNYLSSGNASLFVDFDDWDATDNNPHTITNSGWILADGIIKTTSFDSAVSISNTAWFLPNGSDLLSPESLYGIGTVSFYYKIYQGADSGISIPLNVYTSEDNINWKLQGSVATASISAWQYSTIVIDDANARYVRISKELITVGAEIIGIDDVLITYPASRVRIFDVKTTPEYPSDNIATKVTCTIESDNAAFPAANLSAQLHYKLNTDTVYSVIDMTKNGTLFTSEDILDGTAGDLMDYYITASFSGYNGAQSDNRSPTYFPAGDANLTTNQFYTPPTNTPAAYYLKQEYLGAQHSFDSWTNSTLPGSFIDNGWTFNQIQMNELDPGIWFSSPYAVELLNDGSWLDSYIESPTISNGVGTLSFLTRNKENGTINLQILISRSGGEFENIAVVSTTNNSVWTRHSIEINEDVPIAIRIRKGDATGPGFTILLDNIEISYRPSAIKFSDILFSPGYPAVGQEVYISSKIVAVSNLFEAAADINAKLYYRNKSNGETSYTGPISMLQNGDQFRTFAPIPANVNGSRDIIDFYIEAEFNGYHYKTDKNSRSPSFYPTGNIGASSDHYYTAPLDTPANYQVRPYISDYSDITVVVSNISVTMTQGADHEWNGFLFIDSDLPDTYLWLNGNGFYTGTNYAGTSDIWSDTNQWRTTLPFAGTMQEDATGTLLFSPERGAYLIRFNEDNLGYIIERAAFQDFNTWPASPEYFEESFSQSKVTSFPENFDNWSASIATINSDNFMTWNATNDYYNENAAEGQFGWIVSQAKIIPQLLETNEVTPRAHACQLHPAVNFGNIKTTENSRNGIGTMTVEYRCIDDTFAPSLISDAINWGDSMVKGTFNAKTMPYNQDRSILGSNIWISLIGRYIDDRNYYEFRREQVELQRYRYSLYKMKNGVLTEMNITGTTGGTLETEKEMSLFISSYNNNTKVLIEGYEGSTRKIQYFDDTDPITMQGKTGIRANGIDMAADDITAGVAREQTFKDWPNAASITSFTRDNWDVTYAVKIVANTEVELMDQSATGQPAVISPLLTHGAGNISFRAKLGTGSANIANALIEYSTNKVNWVEINSASVGSSGYTTISSKIDTPVKNIYVRIANDKSIANNTLYIDDIRIEPSSGMVGNNWDFEDDTADGWFASWGNWTASGGAYNGSGVVSPVSFAFEAAPIYAPNNWLTITNILTKSNVDYQTIYIPFHIADHYIPRIKHTYGEASLAVNYIKINSWHGEKNTGTNGWKTQAGWITTQGMASTNNGLEMRYSKALENEDQFLLSPRMTNGVGTISFNYVRSGPAPIAFTIERAAETGDLWSVILEVTNSTTLWSDAESLFSYNVRTNDSMFIRIRNTSPTNSDSIILLDDVNISDFSAKDEFTWTAYNSLITAALPDKLRNSEGNIKGGFLNSNNVDNVDPIQGSFDDDMPFIQSGFLKDGIGEISFWYRAWDSDNIPTMRIKIAPTADTPASNWTELVSIHDIANTEYEHFETIIYNSSNHYVRFYSDTDVSTAGRICMDDIIITAPFGSDVSFRDVTITPEIPLKNDNVYISANVTRTFLNPSNITLQAYWRSNDTNNWGTWHDGTPLPMEHISGSFPIGIWKTIDPIPAKPIDELVQYYVEATFEGVFSEKASPKEDRSFINPDWYFPVDLNKGLINTNPYYYVFSSLPGNVWINEINITDDQFFLGITITQYVEVVGHAGIDISNWELEFMSDTFNTQAWYSVDSGTTLPYSTNGYGFWILGESSLGTVADMILTNTIPDNGAVRLYRSMGAIEDGISFGQSQAAIDMTNNPDNRLKYIGFDASFFAANPLAIIGTGSNKNDFTEANWTNDRNYTPDEMNDSQDLINGSAPIIQIMITDSSINGNQVWLVFTSDAGYYVQPEPWISTNLLDQNGWSKVQTIIDTSYNNDGVYTQKFDKADSPMQFYKVTGTPQ